MKWALQKLDNIEKENEEEAAKLVRKILFENNRKEKEDYRKDEENWLRNEENNGSRRMRRITAGVVPPSGGTPVKQHLVVPQLEGRTTKSSIQKARGSYRTGINLEVSEDSEMVGFGDFQGVHKKDMKQSVKENNSENQGWNGE